MVRIKKFPLILTILISCYFFIEGIKRRGARQPEGLKLQQPRATP